MQDMYARYEAAMERYVPPPAGFVPVMIHFDRARSDVASRHGLLSARGVHVCDREVAADRAARGWHVPAFVDPVAKNALAAELACDSVGFLRDPGVPRAEAQASYEVRRCEARRLLHAARWQQLVGTGGGSARYAL